MIRMCLSGDSACTGIAPCDACEKALYERVLPRAMIAGGFNGSVTNAQKFFEGFKSAHDELKQNAPSEMAKLMGAPEERATEEEKEVEEEAEPASLTEDEISTMGQIEDFVEDEGEGKPERRVPTKSARAMARMARRLKQKRAGNHTSKKRDEDHGKEQQAGSDGDEGELRAGEVPPGGVQPR